VSLQRVWALRVEVEFNNLYREQPLYGDVDAFLREHDFVLWRLANLCHYGFGAVEAAGSGGRLFWADALLVRRELAEGKAPAAQADAARAACVLSVVGVHELAAICR
jgi:hypothetical protein